MGPGREEVLGLILVREDLLNIPVRHDVPDVDVRRLVDAERDLHVLVQGVGRFVRPNLDGEVARGWFNDDPQRFHLAQRRNAEGQHKRHDP